MEELDQQFEGRVLALGAERAPLRGREWAPRSPDLNPLDYSIWSILKKRVYTPRPQTLEGLKLKISQEVANLDEALLIRCTLNIRKRAHLYVQSQGGHFENKISDISNFRSFWIFWYMSIR